MNHPGIIKPVDHSDEDDEQPFYVMPYIEGSHKLSEIIWPYDDIESSYKHDPVASLDFIAKCAEALARSHDAGVIHRDLKPNNILVHDGSPLIIDFGCCLIIDDEGVLTLTDEGVGARNFMAPECEAGIEGDVTTTSDVYSLGKILWCMFSGQRPYAREVPGFNNKIATSLLPDNPYSGFIVDAMLQSVRSDEKLRLTADVFASTCRAFTARIRSGGAHVSYIAQRCVACHSMKVQIGRDRTNGPMNFHADVIVGNPNNNPHLRAKLCEECGTVTLHDTRPLANYKTQLDAAQ